MIDLKPLADGAMTRDQLTAALAQAQKDGSLSSLSTELAKLYLGLSKLSLATKDSVQDGGNPITNAVTQDGKFVAVDFVAKSGDGAALLQKLAAIGLEKGASFGSVVSGYLPVGSIGDLLSVGDLKFARESISATSVGLTTTQADIAQKNDVARATHGVDGAGIKVGILSDSFNITNKGTTAGDIASGDLPASTTILFEANAGEGADEGRAMAQLVHDLAPGASILFATANGGQAAFAAHIIALANAGAKVIVDDVSYFQELMFQDGPIAQAVDQVVASGVTFFSSAGNRGKLGYEGAYTAGAGFTANGVTYSSSQQFDLGSNLLKLNTSSNNFRVVLEWDSPGATAGGSGATNDLDLFICDANGNVRTYSDGTFQASTDNNIGNDPVESVGLLGGSNTAHYLKVGVKNGSTAPTNLKIVIYDSSGSMTISPASTDTSDATLYGHHAAKNAISTGAASFANTPAFGVTPPVLENFSSGGPAKILFDTKGNKLATPEIRDLSIVAADGGNTTFFGSDSASDPDSFPNFFGTSAAAPDAAATAALMLQARSTLTPADIKNLLQDSAIDMDDPTTAGFDVGFDAFTATGLIQADTAVGYAKTLVFTADATHFKLVGSHLNDTFNVADSSKHTLNGVDGVDTLDYSALSGGVEVTLNGATAATVKVAGAAQDTVSNFENVISGKGDSKLTGDFGVNQLTGLGGADTISGAGGDDVLDGGAGIDTALFSGARANYAVSEAAGVVTVKDNVGTDGQDTLKNFEFYKFADKTYTLAELLGGKLFSIAADAASKNEGNEGTTAFTFTVTRSGDLGAAATVKYTTKDGSALAGSDYTAASGTLTFNPNDATQKITILVKGDTVPELDESFSVVLSDASSGWSIGTAEASTKIINDDGSPTIIAIADSSVIEGNTGTTEISFKVTRSGDLTTTFSVDYATSNGTADASDFDATTGTLTFAANQTEQVVKVQVKGDTVFEANETFKVTLSNATNNAIIPADGGVATGTIINDDAAPGGGGGGGGGGGAVTPTPPNFTPFDTTGYNGYIPALIVSDFINGGTPANREKLDDLAAFAKAQFASYQDLKVLNPEIGPYEALGRGFADTATFQTKYAGLSESVFIQSAYKSVFGIDAATAQQQHFQNQIDFFEAMYEKAGVSASQAEIWAKGATLGQMLATATLTGPSAHPYLTEAKNFLTDASDGSVAYGKPLTFWDMLPA